MSLLSFFYYKILLNQVVLSFFSGIIGAFIAGVFAWWATKQAHELNMIIEEDKRKKQADSVKRIINEILIQVQKILNSSFDVISVDKSPYGYINKPHKMSKLMFPLFDDVMKNISIIEDKQYLQFIIQIYSELKLYIEINSSYKEILEKLCQFRKENLNQDLIWNKPILDYFDVEEELIEEEQKEDSKINREFFTSQRILIDDLINKSNIIVTLYNQLNKKIEKFMEIYNERI